MLASIAIQLGEALAVRGVPYRVSYGPERLDQATAHRSRIVIERDRKAGDPVMPPKHQERNPKCIFNRMIAATCRVFAQSTVAGAGPEHHERVADQVVDQVLVALKTIINARRNTWTVGSGKLLTDQEIEAIGAQLWPGVVYELSFAVDRGVTDGAYAGETTAAFGTVPALSEATAGGAHGFRTSTNFDTSDSPGVSDTLPGASTRQTP